MVPFVRTVAEAREVTELLAQNGLQARRRRAEDHHDVRAAHQRAAARTSFLQYFDGMSIGSNDLTQLTLGVDRDSAVVAGCSTSAMRRCAGCCRWRSAACRKHGKYIGICGQGPSDHPDLARWLVDQGIDSLSLNPDTVVETWLFLGQPPGSTPP